MRPSPFYVFRTIYNLDGTEEWVVGEDIDVLEDEILDMDALQRDDDVEGEDFN